MLDDINPRCFGKQAFASKAEANKLLHRRSKRNRNGLSGATRRQETMMTYRCDCGKWHVGHPGK